MQSPQAENRLSMAYLRLRFHDAVAVVCEQHALQPLALAVVNVRPFGVVAHLRVHAA